MHTDLKPPRFAIDQENAYSGLWSVLEMELRRRDVQSSSWSWTVINRASGPGWPQVNYSAHTIRLPVPWERRRGILYIRKRGCL